MNKAAAFWGHAGFPSPRPDRRSIINGMKRTWPATGSAAALLAMGWLAGPGLVLMPAATPSPGRPAMQSAPGAAIRPASRPTAGPATQPATRPAILPPGGQIAAGRHGPVRYVVLQGPAGGPTVLVTAGVHGNEVAGCQTAEALASLKLTRGRLVIIPQANPPAFAAHKRSILGVPAEQANLNRNFPQKAGEPAVGELAAALWGFVQAVRPDWVIDLHESISLRQRDGGGVGSTIITSASAQARQRAQAMREAVNAAIADPQKQFVLLRSPIKGGIARSAADLLGSHTMILETTAPKQALALRAAQHETMVKALLRELKMIP